MKKLELEFCRFVTSQLLDGPFHSCVKTIILIALVFPADVVDPFKEDERSS